MKLMLLRHGIAEDQSPSGLDADRQLTEAGVRKTQRVVEALAERLEPPQRILTSPLIRATQTAELAAAAFSVELQICDVLGDNDAVAILNTITTLRLDSVMLVGHEPSFSELIERLCNAEPGSMQMKKAGWTLMEIEFDSDGIASARLLGLMTPKLLGVT